MQIKDEKEWLKQAEDDLKSADVLLNGGRYTHCVFFCHLAVEKSLKAAYCHIFRKEPPRTHNLSFILSETGIKPPASMLKLIDTLATASVPTRYPEDLRQMSGKYTKSSTPSILEKSKMAVSWIKETLKK